MLVSSCFASLAAGEPPIAVATSLVAALPSDVQAAVRVVCAALQQTDHALVSQVLTLALHRALGRSGWSTALAARSLLSALPEDTLLPPPRLWELCVCVCGALAELPLAECSGEEQLRALRLALAVLHMPDHRAARVGPSDAAASTMAWRSRDGAKRAKTLAHLPARAVALRRAAAQLLLALLEPRRVDGAAAPAVTAYAAMVAQRRVLRATALETASSPSPSSLSSTTSSSSTSSSASSPCPLPSFLLPPAPLPPTTECAAAEGATPSLVLGAVARRQATLSEALRGGFAPSATAASTGLEAQRAWHWVCPLLAATQPAGAPLCAWGRAASPAALLLPPCEMQRGAAWQSSVDLVGNLMRSWAPPVVMLRVCEEAAAVAAEAEAGVTEVGRSGTQGGAGPGRSELARSLLYAAMLREIERGCGRSREIERGYAGESRGESRGESGTRARAGVGAAMGQLAAGAVGAVGAEEAEETAAAVELLSGYWEPWHPLLDTLYALCSDNGKLVRW